MLKIKALTLVLLWYATASAQNFIANGGFEDINVCTEYSARCAPEAWFRIPAQSLTRSRNYPDAVEGDEFGIVVMENYIQTVRNRIYLYTQLVCPLEPGARYQLSLYVNPARSRTFKFGAWFSNQRPYLTYNAPKDTTPTFEITEADRTATKEDGWQQVVVNFTAAGGEEFLTLGNFDPNTMVLKKGDKLRWDLKYLFDQVELIQIDPPAQPCPDREARIAALYAQDSRHAEEPPDPMLEDSLQKQDTLVAVAIEEAEYDEDPPETVAVVIPEIKFIIPDIGFDFGKYTLKPAADSILSVCAAQIDLQHPAEIHILGYTDNVGSDAYNLDLSAKRANSVLQWFTSKRGLSPARFMVRGLGESAPIAGNDTEAGRQANRRVEINFIQ